MIKLLPPSVINQIAAGEVVERPASVLKELLENSLDAGSKEIRVYIEEAGSKKIQVIDDGCGIPSEDLENVFLKHATSKLQLIHDLNTIQTFGFRGEALASISSVSEVVLVTKTSDQETAFEAIFKEGSLKSVKPTSGTQGTNITINSLFENIPARKKFLKSKSTENKVLMEVFYKFAIANPEVSFSIQLDGISKSFARETFLGRTAQILKIPQEDLIEVYYDGAVQVRGAVIHPKHFYKSKLNQYSFVNSRPVVDSLVFKAVQDGYETFLMKNQYSGFVLFVDLPGDRVDINVHPRKIEVRFDAPQEVYLAVRRAVNAGLIRELRSEVNRKLNVQSESNTSLETEYAAKTNPVNTIFEPKTDYIASDSAQDQDTTQSVADFEAFLHATNSADSSPAKVQATLDFSQELLKEEESLSSSTSKLYLNIGEAIQLLNSYIVTDNGKDVLLIDQHAASERYFYEKYLAQLKSKKVISKPLLFPEIVKFPEEEVRILEEHKALMEEFGFEFESFGEEEIKITSVPEFTKIQNFLKLFEKIATDILENTEISNIKDQIYHQMAAILACHTAVRFGDELDKKEVRAILENLITCEDPYNCPHGRPIIQEFGKYDIEKKFKRCAL